MAARINPLTAKVMQFELYADENTIPVMEDGSVYSYVACRSAAVLLHNLFSMSLDDLLAFNEKLHPIDSEKLDPQGRSEHYRNRTLPMFKEYLSVFCNADASLPSPGDGYNTWIDKQVAEIGELFRLLVLHVISLRGYMKVRRVMDRVTAMMPDDVDINFAAIPNTYPPSQVTSALLNNQLFPQVKALQRRMDDILTDNFNKICGDGSGAYKKVGKTQAYSALEFFYQDRHVTPRLKGLMLGRLKSLRRSN